MAEDYEKILIRLASVSEISFMMSPGKLGKDVKPEDIQMGFSSQTQPDIENDRFTLVFGVRYETAGEPILESFYQFVFEVKGLKRFIEFNDNQSITINRIMPHFLSVAVGTMRGIIIVKTAGTNFSKYLLPMVDINRLNDDLSKTRQ